MLKKIFTIKMNPNDSLEMEKVWYEYNAALSISKELMKDEDVDFDILSEYLEVTERRWFFAEKAKEKFGKQYMPEEVTLDKYNYSFDFEKETITYEEA